MKKVVLAFSGGLDTSFCVPYLKNEKNLEVHTVMVNTGGFTSDEAKKIEERALELGAASHTTIDAVETYYQKGIKYLIFGNVLKNNTYPLSVSSERVFQALEVLKLVKKLGADYVAMEVQEPVTTRLDLTLYLRFLPQRWKFWPLSVNWQ